MPDTSADFMLWPDGLQEPYSAVLTGFKGLSPEQQVAILDGQPWRGEFPETEFSFSADFPDNTILSDSLMNPNSMVVASERLKDCILTQSVEKVEYHPTKIRDHKGKVAATYYLINPLLPIDCLDWDESGAMEVPGMPGEILSVDRYVLKDVPIPSGRKLFRISGFAEAILVRRDLADAIAKKCTGLRFRELSA